MTPDVMPIQLRWTDIDANGHVKHSSYYDFGAIARMNFFVVHELSIDKMKEFSIGPVLFREEAIFKREIRYEDKVTIDTRIVRAAPDYSRWSLQHTIYLNGDTVAAILTVDGAWMDLSTRRLAVPNDTVREVFLQFYKDEGFQPIESKK